MGKPLPSSGQIAEALCVREIGGHNPAGVYNACCDGNGRVELRRWDVKRVIREQPGHIDVEVLPGDGGLSVQVLESDPVDPVRNLQVWMPGFQGAGSPFHPLFHKIMDWQGAIDGSLTSRQDRPHVPETRPHREGRAR